MGRPRRDLALDLLHVACVVAVLFVEAVAGHADKEHGLPPEGVLALLALTLPLLWRRRHPLGALVVMSLAIVPVLETTEVYELVAVPAALAAYAYAVQADRRRTLIAGAVLGTYAFVLVAAYTPHPLLAGDTLKNMALVLVPLAIGSAVRDRRAYLQALHDRVEIAERTREEEALRRAEQERLRIAREVHDVVAHSMVAINVQAGVAAHLVDRRPEQVHDALREIKRVSGEALADLRATLGVLREEEAPAPSRPAPGLDALDELAGGLRAAGLDVAVAVDRDGRPVPSAVEAAGYRIVQEALTNVLRHAPDARAAGVRVAVREGAVEIEVTDDGHGKQPDATGSGNGLRGMRERAAAVGGAVDAGPDPDRGGWRVCATLPLA